MQFNGGKNLTELLAYLKMVEGQLAASAKFEQELMHVRLSRWPNNWGVVPGVDNEHPADARAWQAFRVFDTQGTGMVDARDLKHALGVLGHKLTPAKVTAIMTAVGVREEGLIDYVDVVRMLAAS